MSQLINPTQGPSPDGPFAAGGGGSPAAPPYVRTDQSNTYDPGTVQTIDDLIVTNAIDAVGNITSDTGNVETVLGDVIAGRDVTAGRNISATGAFPNGNVDAVSKVRAGDNVESGNNVIANLNVGAGNDVNAGNDVIAANDVVALNDVIATNGDVSATNGDLVALNGNLITRIAQITALLFRDITAHAAPAETIAINDPSFHTIDSIAGATSLLLPTPPAVGNFFVLKDIGNGANNVTFNGNGNFIDGAPTQILTGDCMAVLWNSTTGQWMIIFDV